MQNSERSSGSLGPCSCWLRAALSRVAACVALAFVAGFGASRASAQTQVQGFAVERLYLSAPGAGWFVMDDLDMHAGLGGAIALTGGYARMPVRVPVPGSASRLALVSDQSSVDIGVAASYERFRLSLDFGSPLVSRGESRVFGGQRFTAPPLNLGQDPDGLSDTRAGFEARIFGEQGSALRLGLGAQLMIPAGDRVDYVTDGGYRGMVRALVAGDVSGLAYAAQLGVHLRPLDDSASPSGPRGSELLVGVAAGRRWSFGHDTAIIVGPELFGQSALRSLLGKYTTGFEALLGARFEGSADAATRLRIKLGLGAGIDPEFGTPQWRAVLGFEISSRERVAQ
jgi:hypothetical protein